MKRLLSFSLVLLLLLSGCAAGPKPALSDMLGSQAENAYTSPFGFVIDTTDLHLYSREDLAVLNQTDGFTAEALSAQIDLGNAVSVFAAVSDTAASVTLSLFPASGLPEGIETAEDYAAYGVTVMEEKLKTVGYADVQLQVVEVNLDSGVHPAVLCSAEISEGIPYHLLQICFREGDWMGGLSLSSMNTEEDLRQLLTRITATD